jgi:hypothetical protein
MKCRVTRLTYDFYERELRAAIASGTPEDVCRAARGLTQHCFSRRSLAEWFIDTAPEWTLFLVSRSYRKMAPGKDVQASSERTLLNKKASAD